MLQSWESSDPQKQSACQQESVSNQTNHLYVKGNLSYILMPLAEHRMFFYCPPHVNIISRSHQDFKKPWNNRVPCDQGLHCRLPCRTTPHSGAVSTPAQHLMAAINIHCCRWVFVAINSLINECKLRTSWLRGCVTVLLTWGWQEGDACLLLVKLSQVLPARNQRAALGLSRSSGTCQLCSLGSTCPQGCSVLPGSPPD